MIGNKKIIDLKIKLIPRSSSNSILGREGDVLKVKVTSPPIEGLANKALIKLLSKKLNIPKSSIEIRSGLRSRLKTVRINDLTGDELETRLKK